MIVQDPNASLKPVFNIGSQVAETIELHDEEADNKEKIRDRSIEMMTTVRIPDAGIRYNDYPHQFSGGMRQRVMIAMALSCNPKMLIADEPTTSLDVTIQAQILELMSELKRKYSSSVLLITHDMGVIAELSDRAAIMYAGKIVEYADINEIFANSLHPYTRSLLASIPRPDQRRERLETIPGSVPSLITPPPGCRFHPRCKFAGEMCKTSEPAIEEVEPQHYVACFNYKQVKGV
jgi:peptide/nickel transport system ATP-binding protein